MSRVSRASRLAVIGLLAACAAPGQRPAAFDVVERCAAAAEEMRSLAPREAYGAFVRGCWLVLVQEPRCRQALSESLDSNPAVRASLVAHGCAEGYCPLLSAPKPALCEPGANPSASELPALFAELSQRIRVHELGADEAERYRQRVEAARRE